MLNRRSKTRSARTSGAGLETSPLVQRCALTVSLLAMVLLGSCAKPEAKDLLNPEERRWLAEHQSRLVLAIETGYTPFVFLDAAGQPTGLANDYLLLLESKLDTHFKRRVFSTLDEILAAARNGEVDLVNAVTSTPSRAEYLSFTKPFIHVPNVIIVRKDWPGPMRPEQLPGMKVSLVRGYAVAEWLASKYPGFVPDPVPDDLTGLLNVSFGRSDAVIIDLATASYLIETKSIANLRVADEVGFAIQLSLAATKSQPPLYSILQKGVAAVTDAERDEIHQRWINVAGRSRFNDPRVWLAAAGLLSTILVGLVITLVWNRTLRRQVVVRTQALKEEKQAVQESEAALKELFDEAPVCYQQTDAQGHITRINKTELALLGYTAEEMLGHSIWEFDVDGESSRQAVLARLAGTASPASGLLSALRKKDGTTVPVIIGERILRDKEGRIIGMRATLQDITERKKAEERKAQLEAQFQQGQKMESIGRLAGGVAHDFNNMLAGTMLQLNLLSLNSSLDAEAQLAIQDLQEGAVRAGNLTRQLLMFSRKAVTQKAPIDLNQVVDHLLQMLRRVIGENYRIEFSCPAQLSMVNADVSMMEQVLLNLVVNARDAMASGGVVRILTYDQEWTEQACASHPKSRPGRFVCLDISDNGCGIPPQNLATIFEPFFTTKDAGKGTGLGLSTVEGIVSQHQGWVDVDSQLNQGTTFHVYFPALAHSDIPAPEGAPAATAQKGKETILLVEDDTAVRKMVQRNLPQHGYRVLEASNPRDALSLWQKQGSEVDLLLTDMVMPGGLTGMELVQRLRALRPGLPAIIMSGYSRLLSQGGVTEPDIEFMQKPFGVAELTGTLRRSLDRRKDTSV